MLSRDPQILQTLSHFNIFSSFLNNYKSRWVIFQGHTPFKMNILLTSSCLQRDGYGKASTTSSTAFLKMVLKAFSKTFSNRGQILGKKSALYQ
jgi:hypothetical protein